MEKLFCTAKKILQLSWRGDAKQYDCVLNVPVIKSFRGYGIFLSSKKIVGQKYPCKKNIAPSKKIYIEQLFGNIIKTMR